jgi:hypothetical protein
MQPAVLRHADLRGTPSYLDKQATRPRRIRRATAERGGSRRVVRAGFPDSPWLAGDRVGPRVHLHAEEPTGELLDVASGGGSHGGTVNTAGRRSFHDPFYAIEQERSI